MSRPPRLELTWIGKENRPKLEPRILLEDPEKSYHAAHRVKCSREELGREEAQKAHKGKSGSASSALLGGDDVGDLFDNRLIFGDNLLALKALEAEFTGKVKCIYIDPPYNTGSAFTHYDDGIEHSIWLSLMRDRLEILRRLLSEDGSIWVNIDDNEGHYLKVLMDELYGRNNFVTTFIWQKVDSPNDNKVPITPDHDFLICFAKDKASVQFKQKEDASLLDAYRSDDVEPRLHRDRLLKKNGKNSLRADRPSMFFPIKGPDDEDVWPIHDDGREARWALGKASVHRLVEANDIVWKNRGSNGEAKWVPYTREFAPENPTRPHPTIWTDCLTTRQAKAHQKQFLPAGVEPFDTPKTEELLSRVLAMSTNPGDLVLDSFAGSGTTGAVEQKMGRRWIMVELGDHCHTHIIPRMKKVVDGEDPGGVTKAVDWNGGGGFRCYRIAPSLIEKDKFDNPVISKQFNPAMLAEALCKMMGYRYAPDDEHYWMHGQSTESDFIYVTTQSLTREQLAKLSDDVGEGRSLLVCCASFRTRSNAFENLTIRKIPKAVLARCEWGKDDYSLQIAELPPAPPPQEPEPKKETGAKRPRGRKERKEALTFFGMEEDE